MFHNYTIIIFFYDGMLSETFSVVLEWLPRLEGDKKGTKHSMSLKRAPNQLWIIEEAELALIPSVLPPSQVCEEKAKLKQGMGEKGEASLESARGRSRAPVRAVLSLGQGKGCFPLLHAKRELEVCLGTTSITFSGWTSAWAAVLLSVLCLFVSQENKRHWWEKGACKKGGQWSRVSPTAWHSSKLEFPMNQKDAEEGAGPELTCWLSLKMTTLRMRGSPTITVCEVGYKEWGGRAQSPLSCHAKLLQQQVWATLRVDQIWDRSLHWPGLNFDNRKW